MALAVSPKVLLTRLINNLSVTPVRTESIWREWKKIQEPAKWEDGVKYPGFTYYPRPGEVDPPHEPSKLFMVQRIKPWKGTEYWFKQILFDLKIDKEFKQSKVVIVKNTPRNNMMLWRIKHLVKITPITFPDGVPEEGDVFATHLNYKGELQIKKSISEDKVKEVVEVKPNPVQLKKDDIKRHSIQMWMNPWKTLYEN
uniref:39S ribosomal protein L30, mitochondrial n=1 Tax=Cacopsylla melanoneura TaxID=428564 RepID=A0A8D8QYT7_9HEMI